MSQPSSGGSPRLTSRSQRGEESSLPLDRVPMDRGLQEASAPASTPISTQQAAAIVHGGGPAGPGKTEGKS